MKETAKLFKIKRIRTTAYHPQTNGGLERSHMTLADYLKHFVNENQTNWDDWVDFAMFSYNTSTHTSTKYTPYELVFGHSPELPTSITKPAEFKYTYDDYIDDLTLKLRRSHELARNNLLKSEDTNKSYYDKNSKEIEYKVGDEVYLTAQQFPKSKKLSARYQGPFPITKIESPSNVTLKIKRRHVTVHKDRIKHANQTNKII